MRSLWNAGFAFGVLALPIALSTGAPAADMSGASPGAAHAKMWLACENGREYPIRPIAVSREYDLVTGYLLMTSHRRGVHMRLIPMGSGYRYAGPGCGSTDCVATQCSIGARPPRFPARCCKGNNTVARSIAP